MKYFTVVREPISHIISSFHWQAGLDVSNLSDNQLIERLEAYVDGFDHLNHQVFELACFAFDRSIDSPMPEPENLTGAAQDQLSRAIRNIEEMFIFVGLTEHPEFTGERLETLVGMEGLGLQQDLFRNRSAAASKHGQDRRQGLPPALLRRLEDATALDRELYEAVKTQAFGPQHDRRFVGGAAGGGLEAYKAKLNEPWAYFIEGIHAVGGRLDCVEGAGGTTWSLDLDLPIDAEVGETLIVSLNLSEFSFKAAPCPLALTIGAVGHDPIDVALTGSAAVKVLARVEAGETPSLPLRFSARLMDADIGGDLANNPLPYVIQSITARPLGAATTLAGLASAAAVGTDLGLLNGWDAPQETFTWSVAKAADFVLRLAHPAELAQVGESIALLVELEMSPLVHGAIRHQSVEVQIGGQVFSPIVLARRDVLRFSIDHQVDGALDMLIHVHLKIPGAVTLASLGLNTDAINLLGVQLHRASVLPARRPIVGPN